MTQALSALIGAIVGASLGAFWAARWMHGKDERIITEQSKEHGRLIALYSNAAKTCDEVTALLDTARVANKLLSQECVRYHAAIDEATGERDGARAANGVITTKTRAGAWSDRRP